LGPRVGGGGRQGLHRRLFFAKSTKEQPLEIKITNVVSQNISEEKKKGAEDHSYFCISSDESNVSCCVAVYKKSKKIVSVYCSFCSSSVSNHLFFL